MVVCEIDLALAKTLRALAVAAVLRALSAGARVDKFRVFDGGMLAIALSSRTSATGASSLGGAFADSIGTFAADHYEYCVLTKLQNVRS